MYGKALCFVSLPSHERVFLNLQRHVFHIRPFEINGIIV